MNDLLKSLLAADQHARAFGTGLNPRLRAVIEADLRFPARATAPRPQTPISAEDMPDNVTPLHPQPPISGKRTSA
ncbi:hypothetical protein [Thalassobius sp. MITS945101]|uniref:hypothetical protein n=1 Tax=Thalassobius sp. MITS945101 TaxID=3096994 RepID=UPI00399AD7DB